MVNNGRRCGLSGHNALMSIVVTVGYPGVDTLADNDVLASLLSGELNHADVRNEAVNLGGRLLDGELLLLTHIAA